MGIQDYGFSGMSTVFHPIYERSFSMIPAEEAAQVQARIAEALFHALNDESSDLAQLILGVQGEKRITESLGLKVVEGHDLEKYWVSVVSQRPYFIVDLTFTPDQDNPEWTISSSRSQMGEQESSQIVLPDDCLEKVVPLICDSVGSILEETFSSECCDPRI